MTLCPVAIVFLGRKARIRPRLAPQSPGGFRNPPSQGVGNLKVLRGRFEVVARLSAEGQVSDPVTGATLPAPATTGQARAARLLSRSRYGVDRDEVEAAIQARHSGRAVNGATGRRRLS